MTLNIFASVSDKEGLATALRVLSEHHELKITSSGGTAKHLREEGFAVQDVEELTGFSEVFGGRVKTLHPMVHMGLLYRDESDRKELEDRGGRPFHIVIANLYPFAAAADRGEADLVEYIDIGGVALLRGAAKNFKNVAVFCDSQDYVHLAAAVEDEELRKKLALKAFQHTSDLDARIVATLGGESQQLMVKASRHSTLRYGENPQQKGVWWTREDGGWQDAQILQGKEMSYNNFLDAEACLRALISLKPPACVAVKHNNPCGVAQADTLQEALKRCLSADPVSVFGGIVSLSGRVEAEEAKALTSLFLEVVIAPDYSEEALSILAQKKNLRVVKWPDMLSSQPAGDVRAIRGGFLTQEPMVVTEDPSRWEVHGDPLSAQETEDALLALKVVAELKSNAIAIVSEGQTLGLGMGQVNRVDSVEHALQRATKFHPQSSRWTLASDAFFPFPDSVELMAKFPVRTVIQPGGSVKDKEVLKAAEQHGLRMILTGKRYFRH